MVCCPLRRNISPVAPNKTREPQFRCAAPGKCRTVRWNPPGSRVGSEANRPEIERDMSERQFFPSRLSLTKLVAPPAALSLPARVAGPPRLALFVSHVAVPRRRARELRAAPRAVALCRRAGLFALVPQQVAKRGELPPVAPVLPALRLRPRV